MDRSAELLRHIDKSHLGIEIAPWFAGLTPRRDGYRCLILDVFDTATLRQRAVADPSLGPAQIERIEEVDLVGSATDIEALVAAHHSLGTFDYIVSSHNFEHLPNPIKFLRGCQRVLKPGGVLSMAIPDHRACFDSLRPRTILTDWLQAHLDDRSRPTGAQVFTQAAFHGRLVEGTSERTAFSLLDDRRRFEPYETLRQAFDIWKAIRAEEAGPAPAYHDAHCSALTPASFELMVSECHFLGLTDMACRSVTPTNHFEFYAHLENRAGQPRDAAYERAFYDRRRQLLHAAAEVASQGPPQVGVALRAVGHRWRRQVRAQVGRLVARARPGR